MQPINNITLINCEHMVLWTLIYLPLDFAVTKQPIQQHYYH